MKLEIFNYFPDTTPHAKFQASRARTSPLQIDQPCSSVQYGLQPIDEVPWKTGEDSVAVVEARQHQRDDQ